MYQLFSIKSLLNDDKVRLSTPNGFLFSIFLFFYPNHILRDKDFFIFYFLDS